MNTDALINHREAQDFAAQCTDPTVIKALRGIHNLILESSPGFPTNFLEKKIRPLSPTRVDAFYAAVAQVFAKTPEDWGSESPKTRINKPSFACFPEAIAYVAAQDMEVIARNAMFDFLSTASEMYATSDVQIDMLYCVQMLSALLSANGSLDSILDCNDDHGDISNDWI